MSVLFCDSNCELWFDRAEELGLKVISMPYTLDGQEYYYDLGKKTDFKHFYKRMREKSMTKTSCLNVYEYVEYFEPVLNSGEDVYYITFSHQLSSTFNFMEQAIAELKEKYPERKITIFNTNSISLGAGIQVYYAAKKWKEGATDEELTAFLTDFSKHIATYFMVDDLFHLKRGARLSGAAATVGTILGVKPIIKIHNDGKLLPDSKVKGTKMAISKLASLVGEKGLEYDKYEIFILNGDTDDEANQLAEKIKEVTGGQAKVTVQIIGPVIATHCGPGTMGVVFYATER